jgi:GNAT superfamily N-acetyltransferase
MEIRRATPDEAGLLAALWLRSRTASVPSIPPPLHTDEEIHHWFEEIVLPTSEVWVAGSSEHPTAVMVLDQGWIDQLYVDPTATRRGIGGALVEHAKKQRPTGLRLWTFQSNLDARRFYEAHGFVATAETTGDNEERAPDVCYEWRS